MERKGYRKGAIGALMDEYERAASELGAVIVHMSEEDFRRIVDAETLDKDCVSVQTILSHVISAGYVYADYIRNLFTMPLSSPTPELYPYEAVVPTLQSMIDYTAKSLEGKWQMTDEDIGRAVVHSRWGTVYDLEQLLEHAIVHVLRHRRQIEKFQLVIACDK